MSNIIYPLKTPWKIDYDLALSPYEQVKRRVDSEDWFTQARGYPLIRQEDIVKVKKIKKHE